MMQRICILCQSWQSGGIESFLTNVLLHMDRSALEVDLVVERLEQSIFIADLQRAGIHIIELSGRLNDPKNYLLFARLLREKRYRVVHLNLFQSLSLIYLWLARRAGTPVRIAHSHNTALRRSRTRFPKLLLHQLGKLLFSGCATEFWACSRAAALFMFPGRQLRRNQFRFIPNGIDSRRFHFTSTGRRELRQELGLTDRFILCSVGRLCQQKNQDFLLDVLSSLLRRCPECKLLLIGEGEARSALEEKARLLDIEAHVCFYGVSQQVEKLLWAADVFVFPSLFEGLGIVAIEAQAAGLPTFCSEHVPDEALVSALAERLPLTLGADGWAERLATLAPGLSDEMREQADISPDFDIHTVAEKLRMRYLQEEYEGSDSRAG